MAEVVILTEAGGSIGYGHLTRCLALAGRMEAEVYVHADGYYPKGSNCTDFDWRAHPEKLIANLSSQCLVLVDSYLADAGVYKTLSRYFMYVSVIDDYDRMVYPVDLIINPGVKLPEYGNQTAKVVGGSKYIILRNEIAQQAKKTSYATYQSILVTFGGCDASKIFDWLVPMLVNYPHMTITVVTGNDEVRNALSTNYNGSSIKWLGQVNAKNMAQLMSQADLCISAGGQTLHELAYIGVPTIGVETGADQRNNIEGYIDAGFLMEHLSLDTHNLPLRIYEMIVKYSDVELRQRVAGNGKEIVDGIGVERISDTLMAISN